MRKLTYECDGCHHVEITIDDEKARGWFFVRIDRMSDESAPEPVRHACSPACAVKMLRETVDKLEKR